MSEIRLRPAVPDDADVLAELVNYAGEGLPMVVWSGMAAPGQDPLEVGRARARRETGAFSFRNAIMADWDGRAAGALIDYRLPDTPEPDGPDTPALFRPLNALEAEAAGSWYVNVLAVVPELRGKGIGARLLAEAERRAAADGAPALSIIVSDGNDGARRLYEKTGYRVAASRPMVKEGWHAEGENWVLLLKSL